MDATTATNVGVWLWDEFGKDIKDGFLEFLKRKLADAKEGNQSLQYATDHWMAFQWGDAANRYRAHMQKMYGYIRVLGSNEPVDLDDIFTDVHILERPQAFRRFNINMLQEIQNEPEKLKDEKRMPGLRVVQRQMGHRLYLLGKPGAGKTTFLKFLVYASLQSKLDKLPIFVTIKDWADTKLDLFNFIVKQFDICQLPLAQPFIEYLLESGMAILLCDGLDEVPQESGLRERLTSSLHDFCKKFMKTQVIITCRVAASDYTFGEFTYLEMADFDDQQVQIYAGKWFHNADNKAVEFLAELIKPENKGLRDLGRSPLLLSMICLAYDSTLHIPQRRVELYEEALEALLKKWDANRNIHRDEAYHKLSLGRKRQMFARLAAESFKKGEIFFQEKRLANQIVEYLKWLPPTDATDDPDGIAVLRAIVAQHGIFVERAQGIYAFAHLTFQEYYTAKYIAENIQRGELSNLMRHVYDPRWREVFLLTVSMLDDASEFFDALFMFAKASIMNNQMLVGIQKWSEIKAQKIKGIHPGALRSIYYALILAQGHDLDLPRARARAINRVKNISRSDKQSNDSSEPNNPGHSSYLDLSRDIQYVHGLAIDLAYTIDQKFSKNLDSAYPLRSDVPRNFGLDLARDLDLGRTVENDFDNDFDNKLSDALDTILDFNLLEFLNNLSEVEGSIGTDYKSILFWERSLFDSLWLAYFYSLVGDTSTCVTRYPKMVDYFVFLRAQSKLISEKFSVALGNLSIPDSRAPLTLWKQFEQRLRFTIIQYCGIGSEFGELSEEQIESLKNYFLANRLLTECLKVAYVSDRDKILDRILTMSSMSDVRLDSTLARIRDEIYSTRKRDFEP
jgi:hypothetical protein